jgi:hypothetical protein
MSLVFWFYGYLVFCKARKQQIRTKAERGKKLINGLFQFFSVPAIWFSGSLVFQISAYLSFRFSGFPDGQNTRSLIIQKGQKWRKGRGRVGRL